MDAEHFVGEGEELVVVGVGEFLLVAGGDEFGFAFADGCALEGGWLIYVGGGILGEEEWSVPSAVLTVKSSPVMEKTFSFIASVTS